MLKNKMPTLAGKEIYKIESKLDLAPVLGAKLLTPTHIYLKLNYDYRTV